MKDASKLLLEMNKKKIYPNIRTFNTILRGCLRNGDVETAENMYVFLTMHQTHSIYVD